MSTQACQRSADGATVTRVCGCVCLSRQLVQRAVICHMTPGQSSRAPLLAVKVFYLLLDVLQQEWGRPQIVHWDVEEALNLLLMEVHGDQVGETCMGVTDGDLKTLIWRDSLTNAHRMKKTSGSAPPRSPPLLCTHRLYTSCRR